MRASPHHPLMFLLMVALPVTGQLGVLARTSVALVR